MISVFELFTVGYFSVGGGFVVEDGAVLEDPTPVRFPFHTAAELLGHCDRAALPISQVMLATSWPAVPTRTSGPSCCTSGRSCRTACGAAVGQKASCLVG